MHLGLSVGSAGDDVQGQVTSPALRETQLNLKVSKKIRILGISCQSLINDLKMPLQRVPMALNFAKRLPSLGTDPNGKVSRS